MPSVALTIVLGEKPFHEKQPKVGILDGKGNMIYSSVIAINGDNFDQIRKELDTLADKLIERYKGLEKTPDLIRTSDQLRRDSEEPKQTTIQEAATDTDET